jgi:hypothetical protein
MVGTPRLFPVGAAHANRFTPPRLDLPAVVEGRRFHKFIMFTRMLPCPHDSAMGGEVGAT